MDRAPWLFVLSESAGTDRTTGTLSPDCDARDRFGKDEPETSAMENGRAGVHDKEKKSLGMAASGRLASGRNRVSRWDQFGWPIRWETAAI